MKRNKIVLIDAGTGNLRSVHKALEQAGAQVTVTSDPEWVAAGGRMVLPGVGAFGDFIRGLHERRLVEPILQAAGRGDPLLGICVGMQAFFELGEEHGSHPGLGLLPGKVVRFPELPALKIPSYWLEPARILAAITALDKFGTGSFCLFQPCLLLRTCRPRVGNCNHQPWDRIYLQCPARSSVWRPISSGKKPTARPSNSAKFHPDGVINLDTI